MKLMLISLFAIIFALADAQAMFVATRSGQLNTQVPLRIMVIGAPGDLGKLMANSALVRARIYEEYDQQSQVVIMGIDRDEAHFAARGFRIVRSNRRLLRSSDIAQVIRSSRAVRSLDVYSHSNVQSGAQLDAGRTERPFLSRGDDMWSELARKRMEETFVFLHGCNSGVNFAPWIARNVGVAAYGSLTGTNFQYIYNDQYWAFPYMSPRHSRSTRSSLGTNRVNNCQAGECVRMKPDNAIYRGYWGEFTTGGYPAYKLFCHEGNLRSCQRAAVHNIKTFPSIIPANAVSNIQDYKERAIDFMCPDAQSVERHSRCRRELEKSLEGGRSTYSPFRGNTLNCDLRDCKVQFECRRTIFGRVTNECNLTNQSSGSHSAFTDEFRFLMNAYQATSR
jgi:hypothetical protein